MENSGWALQSEFAAQLLESLPSGLHSIGAAWFNADVHNIEGISTASGMIDITSHRNNKSGPAVYNTREALKTAPAVATTTESPPTVTPLAGTCDASGDDENDTPSHSGPTVAPAPSDQLTFSTDATSLAKGVRALDYGGPDGIREGSTDHPQVYESSRQAFATGGRPGKMKVLVLITDGVTHKGCKDCGLFNCNKVSRAQMEARLGVCTRSNGHICSAGGCDETKCLCGSYMSERFKDLGYHLLIVGVDNTNHPVSTCDGVFARQMKENASPNGFFYAAEFSDLAAFLPKVIKYMS